MSYANMIMYNLIIPSYNSSITEESSIRNNDVINADDPKNIEKVRNILYNN